MASIYGQDISNHKMLIDVKIRGCGQVYWGNQTRSTKWSNLYNRTGYKVKSNFRTFGSRDSIEIAKVIFNQHKLLDENKKFKENVQAWSKFLGPS
jgi:hypothetical protein